MDPSVRVIALAASSRTSRVPSTVAVTAPVRFIPCVSRNRFPLLSGSTCSVIPVCWNVGVHLVPLIRLESLHLQCLLVDTSTTTVLTARRRSSHWEEPGMDDGGRR